MSAAQFTNRVRTTSEARVVKAQYPQNVSEGYNPLFSSIACNPTFSILHYQFKNTCATPASEGILCGPVIYYGGTSTIVYIPDLNGGSALNPNTVIYYGGNSGE